MSASSRDDNKHSNMRDDLRCFFQAAFAHVQRAFDGQVSPDDVLKIGRGVIDDLLGQFANAEWDTADPLTIRQAKRLGMQMHGVRLVGHVTLLREPQVVALPTEDGGWEDSETTCAEFVDLAGDTIETIGITGRSIIDKLQERHKNGGPTELLGIVVLMPTRVDPKRADHVAGNYHRAFYVHVVDVRQSSSSLDLIGATLSERDWVAKTLGDLRDKGISPLTHLYEQVVAGLGVVGVDEFPLLGELLEFVVLQAVSSGRVNNSSGRIHILIPGPPGQGKKLPSLAAQALAVSCVQLSAAKISAAGLVGTSRSTREGWLSQPGALVRAAHGTAVLQDAHGLSEADLRKLGPVLQELIEDGLVRDSVAGGHTWETPVGLIIDMNRVSQLHSGQVGKSRAEAALARLRPLLSRIDVIAEIPANPGRAWRIGARMLRTLSQTGQKLEQQTWAREAKLVVASLRDTLPIIDIEPMRDAMTEKFDELRQINAPLFANRDDAGDLATRTAVSMTRLVLASARACGRAHAIQADVDRAVRFLNMKLKFLALLPLPLVRLSDCPPNRAARREEWVRQHAGQTVTSSTLADEYRRTTGEEVSERTMRRDIQDAGGIWHGNGRWLLPSTLNGDDGSGGGVTLDCDAAAPHSADTAQETQGPSTSQIQGD